MNFAIVVAATLLAGGALKASVPTPLDPARGAHSRVEHMGPDLVSQDVQEVSPLRLLEQKAALLDAYLKSDVIRGIEQNGAEPAAGLVADARRVLADARSSMASGDTERAAPKLDDALRMVTRASKMRSDSRQAESDSEAVAKYEKLRVSVQSYLRTLSDDASREHVSESGDQSVARARELLGNAESHARAGRHREANAVLGDAYRTAVMAVAEVNRGRVVVSRLSFETPADEYAYELRRHESYRMLVEIMLQERSGDAADLRQLADRFLAESINLSAGAQEKAATGDFPAAITAMEAATGRLVRVLRAGGLPVME